MDNFRLRAAFNKELEHKSLREMATEMGLSASTLSRYANQVGGVQSETFARLSAYLEVPLSPEATVSEGKDTLQEIENVIFSDQTLTREAKAGLSDLMEVAYRGLLKHQREETACQ